MATTPISFKASPEEFAAIAEAARSLGLSPGQYARFAALHFSQFTRLEVELRAMKTEIIESHKSHLKKAVDFLVAHR